MPLHKFICLLLIFVVLHSLFPADIRATSFPAQEQSTEKKKAVVQKALQKHKTINVVLKDKRKVSGKVTEQTSDGFTITDSKTGQSVPLGFSDVESVKQKGGLHPAVKVAIAVGIVLGALVAIVYATGIGD